jgi:hypothetical protein
LILGELCHLQVDGDNASGGIDEIIRFCIDDHNSVTKTIPSEIRGRDRPETLAHQEVVDRFIGGDSSSFIPELGDDDRGLSGWLANDHAWLFGDGDAFQSNIAPENGNMERHTIEILGRGCVAPVKIAIRQYGDLAINAWPSPFYRAGILSSVEYFVLAGAIRHTNQGIYLGFCNQRPLSVRPLLKISNFDSERCWIT